MNKSKNILIISPFFFPEPISTGKFNTDMVLKLKESGNNVTVLCSHPFYPEWKVKTVKDKLEGINIIRGGSKMKYPNKAFLRRVILEIWYAIFVFRKIKKLQKTTDILISVFPPSLAFYCILPIINKQIRKIGIIHDLQIIYTANKKGILNSIISKSINHVEKIGFKGCDKLIFLSNEMRDFASATYHIETKKIKVQFPFVTLKEKEVTNDLKDILPSNQYNIVYSGALGDKQNPIELYQVFDYLTTEIDNCKCYFFSQGPIFEILKNRNKSHKIKFYNLVDKKNIKELYERSTIQIIPQLPNTSKGSLPSKLPNILASGTKLLVITDLNSEIEKLFFKHKLHKTITNWDKEIILEAIKDLMNANLDSKYQKEIANKLFNINSLNDEILG